MSWYEDRIDEAQRMCTEAGLSVEQVQGVQAWLLGAVLTHFDPTLVGSSPGRLSAERWREYVGRAIVDEETP